MEIITFILPMAVLFGLMYVMLIMPQRKKEKKTKEMLRALQVGENIVTIGGVMGKVINIKDDELTIESGVEKTKLKIQRWAIKEVERTISVCGKRLLKEKQNEEKSQGTEVRLVFLF